MSSSLQRARPQMIGPWTSRAIACTASKSPGEAMGKPASMTSTPRSHQGLGDFQLLGQVHAGAGRLLAVAQRGVEDDEAVGRLIQSCIRGSAETQKPWDLIVPGSVISNRIRVQVTAYLGRSPPREEEQTQQDSLGKYTMRKQPLAYRNVKKPPQNCNASFSAPFCCCLRRLGDCGTCEDPHISSNELLNTNTKDVINGDGISVMLGPGAAWLGHWRGSRASLFDRHNEQ